MWRLGIIIEMSTRKRPLGPIWSLPGAPGSIIPFARTLCFVQAGDVFGDGVLRSYFTALDVILGLVSIQPSARSFHFPYYLLKRAFLAEMRNLFGNWLVSLHVS